MSGRGRWIASAVLIVGVVGAGAGLAYWKQAALAAVAAESANAPEPVEAISVALAAEREHRRSTTSIGTVLALQSVLLKNELAGTVRNVNLTPGQIVEPGTVLVEQDGLVEQAELKALEAQAALAKTQLERLVRLGSTAASAEELDQAKADLDVAIAQTERVKAVIARKVIRAPFRARVGLSDLHIGQYLEEGTQITSLQGVDDSIDVDFAVAQSVALTLRQGDTVDVLTGAAQTPVKATIVALDSRVDSITRSAMVRARVTENVNALSPGAAVRVRTFVGSPTRAVAVPVNALRKGPTGDHVFVIEDDKAGQPRARQRAVKSGPVVGDEVLILQGVTVGERVASLGSFKLREDVLVAIAEPQEPANAKPSTVAVKDQ